MLTTIVYAHPYDKSFNHAILDTVTEALAKAGKDYKVLDLYADGFNPAMTSSQLKLFSVGGCDEEVTSGYLDVMKRTTELVFIYPVWWSTEPAIVKGFYDKVFLKDVAYIQNPDGTLAPNLDIDRVTVITTSEAPTAVFEDYFGSYIGSHIFASIGAKVTDWMNCDGVSTGDDSRRQAFLKKVSERFGGE